MVGDNLSTYPNLEYFETASASELKSMLSQIRLPYKIVSIYALGGRHIAWVSLTRPIKKVDEPIKEKPIKKKKR